MQLTRFHRTAIALTGLATLLVVAACGGNNTATPTGGGSAAQSGGSATGGELAVLIGSSGPAETTAVETASAAFAKESGTAVKVTAAQDLPQQLAQGFASGQSPDVFYVSGDNFATYAKAGNLLAYGDDLPNAGDFYPALKTQFTYEDKFYCAPKDMSTLALFINTDLWTAAGLTDADIPKNWDDLSAVAKKLTKPPVVGLTVGPSRDRLNSFLLQNGSFLVSQDGKTVTANDPKNVEALKYVQSLYQDGSLRFPAELGAGWGGEAFGKQLAAMTIEGPWLLGAMAKDYPTVKFTAAPLPAGPKGDKGTLVFTNCWGVSATTKYPEQAKAYAEFMTTKQQQLEFAKAFGVIPSIESAKADYLAEFPDNKAFVDGIDYARGVVGAAGIADVLADFDAQLQTLGNGDPKAILESVQQNLTAAIGG